MKSKIIGAFLIIFFAIPVHAHIGENPLLKINGVFVQPDVFDNTVEYSNVRDRAPEESYPLGTLLYEIHTDYILSDSDLPKTLFVWDFGDNTPIRSEYNLTKLSHVYEKEGTYTLKISIEPGLATPGKEVIQVVPITIGTNVIQKQSYLLGTTSPQSTKESKYPLIVGMGIFVIASIILLRRRT